MLKDVRVLGGLGGVILIVALYFGWGMLPEGTGPLKTAYQDLVKIHKEVEEKAGANPDDKEWTAFAKKTKDKTKKISLAIAKSKHAAKTPISGAKSAIDQAVGAKKPKDAEKKIADAEKKLDEAKKKLGL